MKRTTEEIGIKKEREILEDEKKIPKTEPSLSEEELRTRIEAAKSSSLFELKLSDDKLFLATKEKEKAEEMFRLATCLHEKNEALDSFMAFLVSAFNNRDRKSIFVIRSTKVYFRAIGHALSRSHGRVINPTLHCNMNALREIEYDFDTKMKGCSLPQVSKSLIVLEVSRLVLRKVRSSHSVVLISPQSTITVKEKDFFIDEGIAWAEWRETTGLSWIIIANDQ